MKAWNETLCEAHEVGRQRSLTLQKGPARVHDPFGTPSPHVSCSSRILFDRNQKTCTATGTVEVTATNARTTFIIWADYTPLGNSRCDNRTEIG
jgi:hypothetical protein